jgi:hypothetical protein
MKNLVTFLLLVSPVFTFAHPGHGSSDGNSLLHYFSTPEHAIPAIAIALLVAVVLFRKVKKSMAS